MNVFVLFHTHIIEADNEDVKMIGVFSTHATALAAIDKIKTQPGFRDTQEGFEIEEYPLDLIHWEKGYVTLLPGE